MLAKLIKKELRVVTLLIGFFLLIAVFILKTPPRPLEVIGSDFLQYYTAGRLVTDGSSEYLYDRLLNRKVQGTILAETPEAETITTFNINTFRTLPLTVVIFLPLVHFLLLNAFQYFLILNLFLLFLFTYIMCKKIIANPRDFFLTLLLILFYLPVIQNLQMGQLSLILLMLLTLLYLLLNQKKEGFAGIVASFFIIKTQFLILAPIGFFMAKNKKKYLLYFISALTLLLLANFLIVSPITMLNYPTYLFSTEFPVYGTRTYHMASLVAFFKQLNLVDNTNHTFIILANFVIYFLALSFFRRTKVRDFDVKFVSLVLISLPFAVHMFPFDLVMLLLPILLIFKKVIKMRNYQNRYLAIVVILYLAPVIFLAIKLPFLLPLIILPCGFFLLLNSEKDLDKRFNKV